MIDPSIFKELDKGVQEFEPYYLYPEGNVTRMYGRTGSHYVMLVQFNKTIIARHGRLLFMFRYESHDDFDQAYEWVATNIMDAGSEVEDPMVTPVFVWMVKLIRRAILSGWL